MGLGIVVLFWSVVALLVASVFAGVLAAVAYLFDRHAGRIRPGWLLIAAAVPFVSLAYAGVGFAAYATYCEVVRDVDLGIGDSWRVPLGNGYRLVMVDTSDQAFVESPTGEYLHGGLKQIGTSGNLIAGEDGRGMFVIDGARRTDVPVMSASDFPKRFPAASRPDLIAPDAFYQEHRWSVADLIAALLIVVPPVLMLCALAAQFVRSGRAAAKPARG